MVELQLIKAFLDSKNIYNKYIKYIDYNKYKEYKDIYYKIYYIINIYYTKNPDINNISIDTLETLVKTYYPRNKEEEWIVVLQRLRGLSVEESAIMGLLEEERKRGIATRAAMIAMEVADGNKSFEELQTVVSEVERLPVLSGSNFVTTNLEELFDSYIITKGLRWRLGCLNRSIGSLRKSDFGFIFARVESGKTAFAVSEYIHMARQTSDNCIYFCNEEDGRRIMSRIYTAHFGVTLKDMKENRHEFKEKFNTEFGERIRVMDNAAMHRREIEAICRELKPGLIIFDQLDKIRGFTADRYDLQMKGAYQWGRELAKEYCPVIGVCQASGSGEGKKWLTMDDIDSSKTAKPGEADWVIGIGTLSDYPDLRYLNILKNKLSGDEDTEESMRHARLETLFWPELSRYEDLR